MATHELFHTIHQLSRELTKLINQTLQPFGLYSAQWAVLFVLKEEGSMSQSDLCEYLAVEAPPMTRTIQRLIKQDYVRYTQGADKRVKMIHLTEKAETAYPEWEQAVLSANEKLLAGMPDEKRIVMQTLLASWLGTLKGVSHE
ncbi:MarR family winged helix-turn-helix transcriptional regulator [Domibacillus epiphyticus]|uniref:MarR family transcriptional regulator n=1 Tax=Domibacillus epiphyticus TaxID=1714355 RepID=A0A1V2AAQ3_9BACI|nr:MarR family transcriptional regulator [Domibacillus epiphyticus]OMP68030.1 MarR family transcriptional regulator [Domibacillus epiphyticus]